MVGGCYLMSRLWYETGNTTGFWESEPAGGGLDPKRNQRDGVLESGVAHP